MKCRSDEGYLRCIYNCARITAPKISTHPDISLPDNDSPKMSHPARTENMDSRLMRREAAVGFIPRCPIICNV